MRKLLLMLLLAGLSLSVSAQKYGHLNFGNVIALMPETAVADAQLKSYQDSLVTKGQEKGKAFQEKYVQAMKDVQEGKLSPLQQQQKQEELQKEQQELAQLEQDVNQAVQQKRQELLQPIVEKAQNAIDEIAKSNGYVMIFDTSTFNAILFAQDADDIMPLVKAKLNLPDKPVAPAEKKQ